MGRIKQQQPPQHRSNATRASWSKDHMCLLVVSLLLSCLLFWPSTPSPRDEAELLHTGTRLAMSGQLQAAIALLEQADVVQPLEPTSLQLLGGLYGNTGQLEASVVLPTTLFTSYPASLTHSPPFTH